MTSKDYTRTWLIQFLQQTLSKNKSNTLYFDLSNNDKLFIEMKVMDWSTKVFLISNSRLRKDIFLWQAKLRDFNWITLFVDYIDSLLDKHKAKKEFNSIDINWIENDFINNVIVDFNFDDLEKFK